MPAFQFYNPAPVFFDLLGLEPVNGGNLYFYDRGTTNDRDTWSDPDQGVPALNPNPVPLDSAGRANAPIFLDGEYTVVCKDSLGATIWSRDVIPGGDAALTIPALETGEFLTNDGVNLLWQTIRQMPDATGSTGQVPTSNGAGGYTLQDLPNFTPPDPEIAVTTTSFQAGVSTDATKFLVQVGSDSAPASGTVTTSKTVTYPTAFSTAPFVSVALTSSSQPGGPVVWYFSAPPSTTGFTVVFDVAEGTSTAADMVNPVPFQWRAEGTLEVP